MEQKEIGKGRTDGKLTTFEEQFVNTLSGMITASKYYNHLIVGRTIMKIRFEQVNGINLN